MADHIPQAGLPLALLAGDGEDSMHWLQSLLESRGYAVLRERTGHHVPERARATEPDVVVDLELPDVSGVELCRLLRSDPRITGSTPIFLTIPEHATPGHR